MSCKRKYGECVDGVCRCAQRCFNCDCFCQLYDTLVYPCKRPVGYGVPNKKVTNSDSYKCNCIDCNPDKCRRDYCRSGFCFRNKCSRDPGFKNGKLLIYINIFVLHFK
jgi:hypothetical protein